MIKIMLLALTVGIFQGTLFSMNKESNLSSRGDKEMVPYGFFDNTLCVYQGKIVPLNTPRESLLSAFERTKLFQALLDKGDNETLKDFFKKMWDAEKEEMRCIFILCCVVLCITPLLLHGIWILQNGF